MSAIIASADESPGFRLSTTSRAILQRCPPWTADDAVENSLARTGRVSHSVYLLTASPRSASPGLATVDALMSGIDIWMPVAYPCRMDQHPSEQRMVGMNVSVPEALRAYVQSRLADGFGSASEYVRQLIREDQRRRAAASTEAALAEGLASGEFDSGVVQSAFAELRALRDELGRRGLSVSQDDIRSSIEDGRK